MHACPARGSFSVKKRNQKSLGEDPETPDASVRPDRKVCDLPDLGLDDAYKVDFQFGPCYIRNKMRRRHLESVSSRSLSVRGSWGAAPSVFWYGAPGGTQGPLGKGGAAERWRVTPSVSWVTRHGAQPATTRTHKRNAPAASGANYAFAKGPAPPTGEMKLCRNYCRQPLSHGCAVPAPLAQGSPGAGRRRQALMKP